MTKLFRRYKLTGINLCPKWFAILYIFPLIANATEDTMSDKNPDENVGAIELKDTYARPDYVEVERLRNTKEIIVIQKGDIQKKGKRTISDVLRSVPGISVDTAGQGNIDIRGQGSETAQRNLQVLLDGAPITSLSNHPYSTNYDVVPVEQVERIEIIPGGGSVLYGSGTVGGVVNITTNLRGMKDPKSTALAEWSSDGHRLSGSIGSKLGDNVSFLGTATQLQRDLYYKNTYRDSEYYSAGISWDATESQRLLLRASHLTEASQYIKTLTASKIKEYGKDYVPPDKTVTIGVDADGKLIKKTTSGYLTGDRSIDSYNMSYQNDLSDRLHFIGDFFYTEGFYTDNNNWDQKVNQKSRGTKLKLDTNYWDGSDILLGMDYSKQDASLKYIGSYKLNNDGRYYGVPYSFNYEKEVEAVYALNTIKWNKYIFTQGLRRELTKWSFDKVGTVNGSGLSNRWNTALELSAAYLYRDTGRVYARYERGYTLPDGLQISDQSIINGEKRYLITDADDEKYNMYEVGLRDKVGISTANVTLWMSDTNNQLNRFYLRNVNDAYTMNLLKTRRWGADVSLQQTFGKFTLEETYAWLKGRSDYNDRGRRFLTMHDKNTIDFTKSGLQKVPQHTASIKGKYEFTDDLSADVGYTFYGAYNNFLSDADKPDSGVVGSHAIVDTSVHYSPVKHLDVYGGVTNLFNNKYYDYVTEGFGSLIPGQERTFFVGLKATY